MWIDSHCHLDHENFPEEFTTESLIADARKNDVSGMLSINCRISDEFEPLYNLIEPNDRVWCSIGTHPHEASAELEIAIKQSDIVKAANNAKYTKIVAIGESGLDYHYNYSAVPDQQDSFRKHIRACLETDLPLVIHARKADDDIIRILKEEASGAPLKGVMHCFSSTNKLSDFALEIGFYISFSGIVTFKSANELRDIAKTVPLDKMLVETDAPYLAPVPFRGKVNQPAYVRHTGEFLANFLEVETNDFAAQTTQNFYTLFDRAKP